MPFQKIIAGKISSAVTRQIEELILQGVLRPGDRLPAERELSETMEVSRPTLREALADLEERGLIATRPGGGTFIADVLGSAFAAPLIELFATHDTALFDYIACRNQRHRCRPRGDRQRLPAHGGGGVKAQPGRGSSPRRRVPHDHRRGGA
jgi:DNA-binding FadR family transcriptional regulator